MPTTRTHLITRTVNRLDNTPWSNAACQAVLIVPGGGAATDADGITHPNGESQTFNTDVNGAYSQTVTYMGDLSPAGCQIQITEPSGVITSPVGYAYASSIAVSTWQATPVALAGAVTMAMNVALLSDQPWQSLALQLDISQTAIASNGQSFVAGRAVPFVTGSNGIASQALPPTATLNPPTARYMLSGFPDNTIYYFTVPTTPTGYLGAYNAGTAYLANAGTVTVGNLNIPYPNLVLDGGVIYQCILNSTGHQPSTSPTYFSVWAGEPIVFHLTQIVGANNVLFGPANLAASANIAALVDDPNASPASLDQQLINLASRVPGTRRTITASASINAITDDNVFANAAGGAIVATLPAATNRTRKYYFIKTDNTASVTITRAGADLINGLSSLVLAIQYQWAVLESDGGTNWYAQIGTSGADATPTVVGVMQVDQAPASGHPVAVTKPSVGQANGVTPLGSDGAIPSAYLPTPAGGVAEAGRWAKNISNPILAASQAWEGTGIGEPNVIYDAGVWKMWYTGSWTAQAMGYATCTGDPKVLGNWTHYASNPVLGQGASGLSGAVLQPNVLKIGAIYYCYFSYLSVLRVATSTDGITWTVNPFACLSLGGGITYWANSTVWQEATNSWQMIVEGNNGSVWALYHATSTDGLTWTLDGFGPLTSLQVHAGGAYSGPCISNPPKINGLYQLWYHAATASGNLPSNIYRAYSSDLQHWTQVTGPLLDLTGEPAGTDQVADPSVLEVNGTSYMFFSRDNNVSSTSANCVATFQGTLHQLIAGSPTALSIEIDHNGTAVASQGKLNLIDGANTTLTVANNAAAGRVDVTIAAGSGGIYGPISNGSSSPLILNANNQIILSRRA